MGRKKGETTISHKQRLVISQAMMTEEMKTVMALATDSAERVLRVIQSVTSGEQSMAEACKTADFSYLRFRYFIKKLAQLQMPPGEAPKIPEHQLTFEESIYAEVFCVAPEEVLSVMPDDAEETVDYVLQMFPARTSEILRLRYEGLALHEIGEKLGITRERTRQIEAKAYRLLRRESVARILEYGLAVAEEAKAEFEKEKAELIAKYRGMLEREDAQYQEALGYVTSGGKPSPEMLAMVSLSDMKLSSRAYHGCVKAGIRTLADFSDLTYDDICGFRGVGKKAAEEIVDRLREYGVRVALKAA